MKKLSIITAALSTMLVGTAFAGSHGSCGDVKIADMNWASASMMANVDKIILEEGFGCNVEIVPGDTMPTFASMNEKGEPHLAPEMWTNAYAVALGAALDEGRLVVASAAPMEGLGEGWFLLPHTREKHPELKTVADVLARPDLFPHPEDPSKGGFMGCPAGWNCQLTNINQYRAWEMEKKGWLLIDPGTSAGLDAAIAKAADRGENWFGYYWSPTSIIGKYGLTQVDWGIPFAGADNWDGCMALPEQECDDPKPSAWTKSAVSSIATAEFLTSNKTVADYLDKRVYPGPVMNGMLYWATENQATGEDSAIEFLIQHEDVWTSWVSDDVAAKIKGAL